MTMPLKVWFEAEGRLLRLSLNRPKANIIDAAMIAALDGALAQHLSNPGLAAVLLDAEGPHFSFGASVEEHLPSQCAAMLRSLHGLILRMVSSPVPVLVAVHGQCLGGGLELALAGHLLFVAPDAALGQPEMKLGVFATQHYRHRGRHGRHRKGGGDRRDRSGARLFRRAPGKQERELAAPRRQGRAARLRRAHQGQAGNSRAHVSRRPDDHA
jgi:enoyl-CoA hydratase/carnithine racemase